MRRSMTNPALRAGNVNLIRWYWVAWGILFATAILSSTLEQHHLYIVGAVIAGHFVVRAYADQPDAYHLFFLIIFGLHLIYYCVQPLLPIASHVSALLRLEVAGTDRSREVVSQFVFVGLAVFATVGLKLAPAVQKVTVDREINETNVWIMLALALLISLSIMGLKVGLESLSLLYVPVLIANFAAAVLLVKFFKGQLSSTKKVALSIVFVLFLIVAIASGLIAEVFRILVMIFFVFALVKRRFPNIGLILLSLLAIFPLLMFKGLYREIYWLDIGSSFLDSVQNVFGFYVLITENLDPPLMLDLANAAALRLGVSHTFDYVASLTPDFIPYWGGSSYYPLIYKIIPRIVFESKPLEDMGQAFGHQYEFLDELDFYTSVNLPILVEIYLNFGLIGAPICMAILAVVNILVFRALDALLNTSETQIAAKAVFLMGVANIESNFSLVYGGVPFVVLLLWLCGKAMVQRQVKSTVGQSVLFEKQ